MTVRPNYTSALPYGRPSPVGDAELWEKICATAHGDLVQLYADVRGITRQAAKHETFISRYSVTGRFANREPEPQYAQRIGRALRPAPNIDPVVIDFSELEKRMLAHIKDAD